jgi:hypothetical protein
VTEWAGPKTAKPGVAETPLTITLCTVREPRCKQPDAGSQDHQSNRDGENAEHGSPVEPALAL